MSAGAPAAGPSTTKNDPNKRFFFRLLNFFQNAERHSKDEAYAYLPISHLLSRLADACRHADASAAVGATPQFFFKNSRSLRRRIPDFSLLITFLQLLLEGNPDDHEAREALLVLIWEVKPFAVHPWFSHEEALREDVLQKSEELIKSYLSQVSEQALFAFHQFDRNVVPSILSQGNCFTLLKYIRPPNWNALTEKYAGQFDSTVAELASAGDSTAASTANGETAALAAAPVVSGAEQPEASGLRSVKSGKSREEDTTPVDNTSSLEADSTTSASDFEEGDLPVPEVMLSGFILTADGLALTPEFTDAVYTIIEWQSDLELDAEDSIFKRPPCTMANVPTVQRSLTVANNAISTFRKQQDSEKAAEPVPEDDQGPSAVPSEFVDPDAARLRSPPPGKYWTLRGGQVDWKTTAELKMLQDARREAEAADKAAARPSKRRKLNRSGDAAPPADAQEPASGLNASANTYRPPAMGTRSRTKATAAVIAEPAVASPSQLAHGPPPDGRNKVQDRKRKDNKKSRE